MKPSWKLSEAQKIQLVKRYKGHEKLSTLEVEFGVNAASISGLMAARGLRRYRRRPVWREVKAAARGEL